MRLGLLGAPENKAWTSIPYSKVDCPEHAALNLEAAEKSIVLLKNSGVLPLNKKTIKTIGVIGPNADNRLALEANYSGTASRYSTPLEGIKAAAEEAGVRVLFSEGCHLYKDRVSNLSEPDDRFSEARIVAKNSDVIIVCLGLDPSLEGEESDAYAGPDASGDKLGVELIGRQNELLANVFEAAAGKPVIVVLLSGSALAAVEADKKAGAVIQAFYPGSLGGVALAKVLFGQVSPSGKLPVTFYRATSDLPAFTDYNMEGRTYRYFKGEPLYPFGFGLTYSTFTISGLEADTLSCTVKVKNTGAVKAREVVQVYTRLEGQKEIFSLCGIGEVFLAPGEETRLKIKLGKTAFARYDKNGDLQKIPGTHRVYAGFTQPVSRSAALYGQKPLETEIRI
jgi:beta-glucosidase